MIKYVICFIAKVILGSFAIATYSVGKNAEMTEIRLLLALLSSVAIFGCVAITIWQFS